MTVKGPFELTNHISLMREAAIKMYGTIW